jgi:transposase
VQIYLVLDNFSSHKRAEVQQWCRANNVEQVFTATYSSWMNRIECHFAAFKQCVIENSDHPDHAAIARAAQKYLRWRNRHASDERILKAQNTIRVL